MFGPALDAINYFTLELLEELSELLDKFDSDTEYLRARILEEHEVLDNLDYSATDAEIETARLTIDTYSSQLDTRISEAYALIERVNVEILALLVARLLGGYITAGRCSEQEARKHIDFQVERIRFNTACLAANNDHARKERRLRYGGLAQSDVEMDGTLDSIERECWERRYEALARFNEVAARYVIIEVFALEHATSPGEKRKA
ncbi:hypothetical protein BU23DRAFT_571559 [Bimuria novae-zelandiae CBS 107.79]|uniref:Uncharacterized protein n=1 Tax=Bimuria novae-zelandiae CBS 107.79 TaxID=1447943 RepID=A0A6A5V094_9PLEO|nr:hypothetical protein BU23DRAFT_571559 [Bimuria novae-zelandiae CBS 107.79]